MIELNLSLHRKTRIWINEFPKPCFDSTSRLQENYSSYEKNSLYLKNDCIAVELSIPVGARIIYGLLGAKFNHNSSDHFSLEIYSLDSKNTVFETPIYSGLDVVYVGLPSIYLKSVKRGFQQFFEDKKNKMPSGNLIFKCAAHSEVGSNERIFEQLAIIISNYFFSGKKFEKNEDYFDLFSSIL